MYKKLREPINAITHLTGAGLSLIALIAMLAKVISSNPTTTAILSVIIFGNSIRHPILYEYILAHSDSVQSSHAVYAHEHPPF